MQLDFQEKQFFLECLPIYIQIFGATNFGLVLGNGIVIAMIFIKKYVVKLGLIGLTYAKSS